MVCGQVPNPAGSPRPQLRPVPRSLYLLSRSLRFWSNSNLSGPAPLPPPYSWPPPLHCLVSGRSSSGRRGGPLGGSPRSLFSSTKHASVPCCMLGNNYPSSMPSPTSTTFGFMNLQFRMEAETREKLFMYKKSLIYVIFSVSSS